MCSIFVHIHPLGNTLKCGVQCMCAERERQEGAYMNMYVHVCVWRDREGRREEGREGDKITCVWRDTMYIVYMYM